MKSGYTLIEIMIVVLLIGMLAAIAIPNFLRANLESKARTCVAYLKQIQEAKERWALSTGAGPGVEVNKTNLVPDFLKTFPYCPGGGAYTIGTVTENATCSIGTNNNTDTFDNHQLP